MQAAGAAIGRGDASPRRLDFRLTPSRGDRLAVAAQKSFEQTGIWFLARGASRITDEQETVAVWGDLLQFGDLTTLPSYSEENRQQAIKFWQSWQNRKTGRLYNPSSGSKIVSRICGYVGMANFPEAILRTAIDNLLAHRNELYATLRRRATMARRWPTT